MSWPLDRMASSLLIALAVALSVNGRLRCFRIATHPFQASIGSQSGISIIIIGLWLVVNGLWLVVRVTTGSPLDTESEPTGFSDVCFTAVFGRPPLLPFCLLRSAWR